MTEKTIATSPGEESDPSRDPNGRGPNGRGPKLTDQERMLVLRYAEAGLGTRRIARRLGRSRKAIRHALAELSPSSPAPKSSPGTSKLDPFREMIQEKVGHRLTANRILREIRQAGYNGGRTILTDYVRALRGPKRKKPRVKRRFETGPAAECQIDFSPYRVTLGKRKITVHVFACVLHHSRQAYVQLVLNERLPTVLEGVVGAFEYFEGAPLKLVMDRITAAVFGTVGRSGKVLWHPDFTALMKHYGPDPFLCKPRDPDRKGAVEKFIGYFEKDFIWGSEWASLAAMNIAARGWLNDIANVRDHETTGQVPREVWLRERDFLIRLPGERFPFWREETRSVADDATISMAGAHYTVPAELAPGTVRVRLYAGHFEVLDGQGQIALSAPYAEGDEKKRLHIDPAHYDSLGWGAPSVEHGRTRQLEERLLVSFGELAALIEGIRERTKGAWHMHLSKLIGLTRTYGESNFRKAALRAQSHGAFSVHTVKRILEREHPLAGIDDAALPPAKAADRVHLTLGDVDGGDLSAYDELDTLDQGAHDDEDLSDDT